MTRAAANKETEAIRYLIHQRLRARLSAESPPAEHLDEDTISAFVEGRLEENESSPVVRHLIVCTTCRQMTAQLVRLESQFAESENTSLAVPPEREPSLLERLTSRLTPSLEEDAVFAYHDQSGEIDRGENETTESKPEDSD